MNKCLKTQGNGSSVGLDGLPGLEAIGISLEQINFKGRCKASDFRRRV
jgi:hypothetical protein